MPAAHLTNAAVLTGPELAATYEAVQRLIREALAAGTRPSPALVRAVKALQSACSGTATEPETPTSGAFSDASGTTEPAGVDLDGRLVHDLSADQAADQLDCDATYVRRLCRHGVLDAIKDGRTWRIRAESVTAHLHRRDAA